MAQDDQVEENEQTESKDETSSEDNQEAQETKQSNEDASEQDTFELPDGRKVDASTLSKEWKDNFYPEFTRRSQELSKLRKESEEKQAKAETDARSAVADNNALKDVPVEVKEAIVNIVTPLLEQREQEKTAEQERINSEKEFKKNLDSLEKEFDGKKFGVPKFDRNKVLVEMRKPENKIFDPKQLWIEMNRDSYEDYLVKKALKDQSGGLNTESTQGDHSKPDPKTPKTFQEARKAALSRFLK